MFKRIVFMVACWAVLASAQGSKWAAIPITKLASQADLVVEATLERIGKGDSGTVTADLRIVRSLKGQPPSLDIAAQRTSTKGHSLQGTTLPKADGTGIWFLKVDTPRYEILALANGNPRGSDLFLRVDSPDNVPTGTLNQQLLAYATRAYIANPNPLFAEDHLILASLDPLMTPDVDTADQLAAANVLLGSISRSGRRAGLTAALRLGSVNAMASVLKDLTSLSAEPGFSLVVDAIRNYPKNEASIPTLKAVAEMHTDPPVLDMAIAGAFMKIGGKAVLPALALLLDSKDPQAQRTAAWYFSRYTLLAEADGTMPDSGPVGPFSTVETELNNPVADKARTPAQFAAFWKDWWAQNKQKLGF